MILDDDRIEILVVEDNPAHIKFIDQILSPFFSVTFAETMRQAEIQCSEELPDLILQDLCLPDEFGLDTVKRAKKMAKGVPIVILSDYVTDEFRLEVVDEQVAEALKKGDITSDAIIRVLQTTLVREEARVNARVQKTLSRVNQRIKRRLILYQSSTERDGG